MGRRPLTVRPTKSPSTMERPLRMARRQARIEERMIHNVFQGEANALSLEKCSCVVLVSGDGFRMVSPCKRHSRLKAGLRG